jgi:hypothetical protein
MKANGGENVPVTLRQPDYLFRRPDINRRVNHEGDPGRNRPLNHGSAVFIKLRHIKVGVGINYGNWHELKEYLLEIPG